MIVPDGLKICARCILPETFPAIRFDQEGVCSYCRQDEKAAGEADERKGRYRERLDSLVEEWKGKAPTYDAILAYSGGKDSSYTLKLLRETYDLRILALTFDNHFVSPAAWENIRQVTNHLHVDHMAFRPSWPLMKSIFVLAAREDIFPAPTLLRASALCTACIGFVKSVTVRTALEMSIPFAAYGWSPGQAPIQAAIMKTNAALLRQNQKAWRSAFEGEMDRRVGRYLIPDSYYELYRDRFPHNIHPLAFFDYNEERIVSELREIGWKPPEDTDSNSTNCLLNAFANQCHLTRHGFHPYVMEIANMVRQGVMTRQEGIKKIYTPQDRDQVAFARRALDF